MKKFTTMLLMVALLMFAIPTIAFAGEQDFNLVNNTGVTITNLYVGSSSSDTWGEDILGVDVLGNGESADIIFPAGDDTSCWDIKVTDTDGNEYMWYDQDLFTTSSITLDYDGASTWATIE